MDVTVTVFGICLAMAIILPQESEAARNKHISLQIRSPKVDGPPVRPSEFTSVEELNQYLARVAKYYKMMGRPRWVVFI